MTSLPLIIWLVLFLSSPGKCQRVSCCLLRMTVPFLLSVTKCNLSMLSASTCKHIVAVYLLLQSISPQQPITMRLIKLPYFSLHTNICLNYQHIHSKYLIPSIIFVIYSIVSLKIEMDSLLTYSLTSFDYTGLAICFHICYICCFEAYWYVVIIQSCVNWTADPVIWFRRGTLVLFSVDLRRCTMVDCYWYGPVLLWHSPKYDFRWNSLFFWQGTCKVRTNWDVFSYRKEILYNWRAYTDLSEIWCL